QHPVVDHRRDRVHGRKLAKAVSETRARLGRLPSMDEFTIAIALWDGVEELDFAGPYEVLTAWSRMSERQISVRTVAASTDTVRCAHDLKVVPDTTWDAVGELDLLVLPGGDTRPLQADDSFLERIRSTAASGTLMTSVCTGALVFAKAGLLADRPA